MSKAKSTDFFIQRHRVRVASKRSRILREHRKALDGIQLFKDRIRLLRETHGFMATLFNAVLRAIIGRFKRAIEQLQRRCCDLLNSLSSCCSTVL